MDYKFVIRLERWRWQQGFLIFRMNRRFKCPQALIAPQRDTPAALQTIQEIIMRTLSLALAALFLTGCASAPMSNKAAIYDHKYNTYSYAAKSQSEFVGTSTAAKDPAKAKPSWYSFGHP